MRFIAKSPSAARRSPERRGLRLSPSILPLRGLAPVYGKAGTLSPIPRFWFCVFWAFLAGLCPCRPQIRPPELCQRLRLGEAPGGDLGMIAGNQDFRDRLALEMLRAGILRVFQ